MEVQRANSFDGCRVEERGGCHAAEDGSSFGEPSDREPEAPQVRGHTHTGPYGLRFVQTPIYGSHDVGVVQANLAEQANLTWSGPALDVLRHQLVEMLAMSRSDVVRVAEPRGAVLAGQSQKPVPAVSGSVVDDYDGLVDERGDRVEKIRSVEGGPPHTASTAGRSNDSRKTVIRAQSVCSSGVQRSKVPATREPSVR